MNEMLELVVDFREKLAELIGQYDPEQGDTEKVKAEIGTATLDEIESWIMEQKGE